MRDKIDKLVLKDWEESKAQVSESEWMEDRILEAEMILEARNRYDDVKQRFDEAIKGVFGNAQSSRPQSE